MRSRLVHRTRARFGAARHPRLGTHVPPGTQPCASSQQRNDCGDRRDPLREPHVRRMLNFRGRVNVLTFAECAYGVSCEAIASNGFGGMLGCGPLGFGLALNCAMTTCLAGLT